MTLVQPSARPFVPVSPPTAEGERLGDARRTWLEHTMGMPVSIQLRGPGLAPSDRLAAQDVPAEVREAVRAAFERLFRADDVFSTYKPDSPLSRARRGEVTWAEAEAAHPEMVEVRAACEEAFRRTGGAFDAMLPDADGVRTFDPTGLAKGWAIGKAAVELAKLHGYAYCINAGGDVAVGGQNVDAAGHPVDRPWKVGIEDPRHGGTVHRVVELRAGGVATSGFAARGAHIIDPATGLAVEGEGVDGSVTVAGPSIMWADVYATALFVGAPALQAELDRSGEWLVVRL